MLDIIERKFEPFVAPRSREITDGTAAVLLPLVDYPSEPHIVLTQRAGHLNSHPGQVSFPGGKFEPGDDNLLITALRETEEEIGVPSSEIRIVTELPFQRTRFNVNVAAFLGVLEPGQNYRVDSTELDAVFEVPLGFFLDPTNIRYQTFEGPGYKLNRACYPYNDFIIWGFTLGVLIDLLNDTLNADIDLQYRASD